MKRVALITGGSRGIGYGIAQHLAQNGFDIAINGVRPAGAVTDAINELRNTGADVLYCQGNTGLSEDRKRILKEVEGHFGKLNVLVNNAGIAPKQRRDLLEMTEESFDDVLNINLKGAFFLAQQSANWMVEQKFPTAANRPHGMGWEGKYLWLTDSNLNAFFRHDTGTGEIVEKIQLADSDPLPHGMSIWNGVMWYCDDVGVICRLKL